MGKFIRCELHGTSFDSDVGCLKCNPDQENLILSQIQARNTARIVHAADCPCEHCKQEKVELVQPIPANIPINSTPPLKAKNIKELNEKVEYYANYLQNQINNLGNPQQKPKIINRKPPELKPCYKRGGLILMIIITFIAIYGIYLYYMAQHGKHIVIPFIK